VRVTPLLWGILGYLVVQMLVGVWASRRVASADDYWVAGRRLGPGFAAFSIFATWFGAETCIGSAAALYEEGLAGSAADPVGYGICLLGLGLTLAAPLWRRKLTTLADLFRERFSPGVERFAVLLLVPGSLLWAAAQIRAFAQVLASSSHLGLEVTIGAAALIVIAYTGFGGLLADAATDVLQGAVLVAGLLLLGAILLWDASAGFGAALASLDPARLSWFRPDESLLSRGERWAIPILGSLVTQEIVSRLSASRSAQVARNATLVAGVGYLAIGMIPALIGLAGPALVPGLEDPEQLLPRLVQERLPGVAQIVFIGALVSAILSTVDSALLAASSLLTHNLVIPLRRHTSQAAKLRIARAGTVLCGIGSWALAHQADSIYELVETSSAFGSGGLLVVVLFGLFTRLGGRWAAFAGLGLGAGVYSLAPLVCELETPYLAAIAAAALGYLAAAALEASARRARPAAPGV
jgi:Na+/proline symporter